MSELKEVAQWLVDARSAGANFLIVAMDREEMFEGTGMRRNVELYPVRIFAECNDDVHQAMHRVMGDGDRVEEVYDLRVDLKAQLALRRAYLVPRGGISAEVLAPAPSEDQLISANTAHVKQSAITDQRSKSKPVAKVVHKPKPKPKDHEAPQSELEAAMEDGAGSLAGRLRRAVDDE